MEEVDKPLRRRRRWFIALGAIVGLAMIQSVTFTPAVEVRYVEDPSGKPIDGMTVTAVWHLYAGTPAGSNPSRVLRVQAVKTDRDGIAYIPTAVMLHPPVFPFGINLRQIYALPVLYSNDGRYSSNMERGTYWDDTPSFSLLTFQKTSIDETTVKLEREVMHSIRDDDDGRHLINALVSQAYSSCRRSKFCQSHEVSP